jgi:peptidoglycan/LPS O-acetylase OafA/YrhL
MNIFAGMILAELSYLLPAKPSRIRSILPCFSVPLGLYLLSYPRRNPHYAQWSRNLQVLGGVLFPSFAKDFRYWHGIGAQILCATILLSPSLQSVLSHRYLLWLGKVSFTLYLIHVPLMRTVLAWAFAVSPTDVSDTKLLSPQPSELELVLKISGFLVFLFGTAHLWLTGVEPRLDQFTAYLYTLARTWGRSSIYHRQEVPIPKDILDPLLVLEPQDDPRLNAMRRPLVD